MWVIDIQLTNNDSYFPRRPSIFLFNISHGQSIYNFVCEYICQACVKREIVNISNESARSLASYWRENRHSNRCVKYNIDAMFDAKKTSRILQYSQLRNVDYFNSEIIHCTAMFHIDPVYSMGNTKSMIRREISHLK